MVVGAAQSEVLSWDLNSVDIERVRLKMAQGADSIEPAEKSVWDENALLKEQKCPRAHGREGSHVVGSISRLHFRECDRPKRVIKAGNAERLVRIGTCCKVLSFDAHLPRLC